MERGMLGNWHVPCGAGEKPEITSNAYLLLRATSFVISTIVRRTRNFYRTSNFITEDRNDKTTYFETIPLILLHAA